MNASLAISYSPVGGFPAGTVLDHIRVTITGNSTPAQSQSVAPGVSPVVFANVPADTYSYQVDAVDGNGATLTSRTGSFVVSAPTTVTLNLPSGVSVTVT